MFCAPDTKFPQILSAACKPVVITPGRVCRAPNGISHTHRPPEPPHMSQSQISRGEHSGACRPSLGSGSAPGILAQGRACVQAGPAQRPGAASARSPCPLPPPYLPVSLTFARINSFRSYHLHGRLTEDHWSLDPRHIGGGVMVQLLLHATLDSWDFCGLSIRLTGGFYTYSLRLLSDLRNQKVLCS